MKKEGGRDWWGGGEPRLIINIRRGSLELRTNERDFLTNYARNQVGKISQGAAAAENVCGQGFPTSP